MGEFSGFALVPEQGAIPQKHQLDPDMQRRIEAMAARVDIRDNAAVMGFGARAQKEMGAFTDIALEQMLRQDIKPLEGVMQTLAEQIRSCSFTSEAKGFLRRMFGSASPLAEVRASYEKAVPKINACADEMTDRRVALMRDSALLDRLYERNEGLYRELCSLIVIGDEAIRQAKERGENPQDIARMERRVQDLRITQIASTQLAAQIRAVQASDETTCAKLQSALEVTIPLWKSQMAAALGLARATDSLRMQQKFNTQAERGIRSGAKELNAQVSAYSDASGESDDRQRAQQTADALLDELHDIEQSLAEQQQIIRLDLQSQQTRFALFAAQRVIDFASLLQKRSVERKKRGKIGIFLQICLIVLQKLCSGLVRNDHIHTSIVKRHAAEGVPFLLIRQALSESAAPVPVCNHRFCRRTGSRCECPCRRQQ